MKKEDKNLYRFYSIFTLLKVLLCEWRSPFGSKSERGREIDGGARAEKSPWQFVEHDNNINTTTHKLLSFLCLYLNYMCLWQYHLITHLHTHTHSCKDSQCASFMTWLSEMKWMVSGKIGQIGNANTNIPTHLFIVLLVFGEVVEARSERKKHLWFVDWTKYVYISWLWNDPTYFWHSSAIFVIVLWLWYFHSCHANNRLMMTLGSSKNVVHKIQAITRRLLDAGMHNCRRFKRFIHLFYLPFQAIDERFVLICMVFFCSHQNICENIPILLSR